MNDWISCQHSLAGPCFRFGFRGGHLVHPQELQHRIHILHEGLLHSLLKQVSLAVDLHILLSSHGLHRRLQEAHTGQHRALQERRVHVCEETLRMKVSAECIYVTVSTICNNIQVNIHACGKIPEFGVCFLYYGFNLLLYINLPYNKKYFAVQYVLQFTSVLVNY